MFPCKTDTHCLTEQDYCARTRLYFDAAKQIQRNDTASTMSESQHKNEDEVLVPAPPSPLADSLPIV